MADDGTNYPVLSTIPTDNNSNNDDDNNNTTTVVPAIDTTDINTLQTTRQAVRQRKSRAGCCGS